MSCKDKEHSKGEENHKIWELESKWRSCKCLRKPEQWKLEIEESPQTTAFQFRISGYEGRGPGTSKSECVGDTWDRMRACTRAPESLDLNNRVTPAPQQKPRGVVLKYEQASESPGDCWAPLPEFLVHQVRMGPGICISNKFLGDVDLYTIQREPLD